MSTARKTPVKTQGKKKLKVFGPDVATGKQVSVLVEGVDPADGTQLSGIDIDSGKKVTFTVQGRHRAG